jgi:hypothetical protein
MGTLTSINDRVSQIHDLQTTFGSHLAQLSQMAEAVRNRIYPETSICPELRDLVDLEGVNPEIELVVPLRSLKDLLIEKFWNPLRPCDAESAIDQSALEVMTKEVHWLLEMSYRLSEAAVADWSTGGSTQSNRPKHICGKVLRKLASSQYLPVRRAQPGPRRKRGETRAARCHNLANQAGQLQISWRLREGIDNQGDLQHRISARFTPLLLSSS